MQVAHQYPVSYPSCSSDWGGCSRHKSPPSLGSVANVAEQVQKSVVGVTAYIRTSVSAPYSKRVGTGFVVDGGTVLTNAHVVAGAAMVRLQLPDGSELEVTRSSIMGDPEADIAMVLHPRLAALPPLQWADSRQVTLGQPVMAIGNPLGFRLRNSVSAGVVSVPSLRVPWNRFPIMLTDTPVNPGNSGGPLVDMKGQVVGMVTRKGVGFGLEGLTYALPSNSVRQTVERMRNKTAGYIWDGLELTDTAESSYGLSSAEGIRVTGIYTAGPAMKADIKVGDIITHIQGKPIQNLAAYYEELDKLKPGATVLLKRKRGNTTVEVSVTLMAMPASKGNLANNGIWRMMSPDEIDFAGYAGQYFASKGVAFEKTWGYQPGRPPYGSDPKGYLFTEFAFVAHHIKLLALNGGSVDYGMAALLAGVVQGQLVYTVELTESDPTVSASICQQGKCWPGTPGPAWPGPSAALLSGSGRVFYVQFPSVELDPVAETLIQFKDKNGAPSGTLSIQLKNLW